MVIGLSQGIQVDRKNKHIDADKSFEARGTRSKSKCKNIEEKGKLLILKNLTCYYILNKGKIVEQKNYANWLSYMHNLLSNKKKLREIKSEGGVEFLIL